MALMDDSAVVLNLEGACERIELIAGAVSGAHHLEPFVKVRWLFFAVQRVVQHAAELIAAGNGHGIRQVKDSTSTHQTVAGSKSEKSRSLTVAKGWVNTDPPSPAIASARKRLQPRH